MDVSSLEHVVIRAKLGDIIGYQIIQIAEQAACKFHLIIIASAIKIVQPHRCLERYTSGLGTCTVGIQSKLKLSVHWVMEKSISYLHCVHWQGKPAGGWWCTEIRGQQRWTA